uniref:Uncharacterized protein n=1 Tax=Romanomermis culicivorax TaxID=13658 RepID=A0A915L8D9_ROMCU
MATPQIEVVGDKMPSTTKVADVVDNTTTKSTVQSTPSTKKIIDDGDADSAIPQSSKSSPHVSGDGDDKQAKKTTTAAGKSELHVKWLEVKKIVIDYTTPVVAADSINAASLDPNTPLELPPVELLPSIPEPPSLKSEASAADEASKLPTKEVTKKSENLKTEGTKEA